MHLSTKMHEMRLFRLSHEHLFMAWKRLLEQGQNWLFTQAKAFLAEQAGPHEAAVCLVGPLAETQNGVIGTECFMQRCQVKACLVPIS